MVNTGWSGKGSGLLPVTAGRVGAMRGCVSSWSGSGRDYGATWRRGAVERVNTVEEALQASLWHDQERQFCCHRLADLDMFSSYVERGERFQGAVQALEMAA